MTDEEAMLNRLKSEHLQFMVSNQGIEMEIKR